MGRCGLARDRKRSAGQTRLVWNVSAARRAHRISFSGGDFSDVSRSWLTNEQFFAFGWRIPFLASAALVLVGLYVRLTITETPVFREALSRDERVKVPMFDVFRESPLPAGGRRRSPRLPRSCFSI